VLTNCIQLYFVKFFLLKYLQNIPSWSHFPNPFRLKLWKRKKKNIFPLKNWWSSRQKKAPNLNHVDRAPYWVDRLSPHRVFVAVPASEDVCLLDWILTSRNLTTNFIANLLPISKDRIASERNNIVKGNNPPPPSINMGWSWTFFKVWWTLQPFPTSSKNYYYLNGKIFLVPFNSVCINLLVWLYTQYYL
jgi:hypothetical protein